MTPEIEARIIALVGPLQGDLRAMVLGAKARTRIVSRQQGVDAFLPPPPPPADDWTLRRPAPGDRPARTPTGKPRRYSTPRGATGPRPKR